MPFIIKSPVMYKVYFEIWRGFSSSSPSPAGTFDTLGDAIDCARKCYGYVQLNNRIVEDFRVS
jgi:hypothetical protein